MAISTPALRAEQQQTASAAPPLPSYRLTSGPKYHARSGYAFAELDVGGEWHAVTVIPAGAEGPRLVRLIDAAGRVHVVDDTSDAECGCEARRVCPVALAALATFRELDRLNALAVVAGDRPLTAAG